MKKANFYSVAYSWEQTQFPKLRQQKCGVYQLINTKESKNVLKDHNIVLEKGANGKISGRFYGTTDDFVDAREVISPVIL